ncbi:hypothetical protein ACFQ3L_05255 [Lacticaseibacillus jixianensis]|uniref:Cell division protein FtsL n=1 Tax=Lacticaseibacillus jixianensis TaxID=2486012 RepID=A0ABW4B9I1_9LACO|nr:hypothetical protein [Lacticaseibacillus jixianensis]
MVDNTARQLDLLEPRREEPHVQPQTAPKPQPESAPKVAFSPLERLLSVFLGLVAVGFCLCYLTASMHLANLTRSYQNVQAQVTAQKRIIADDKQTVGELSNSDRLNSYAQAHGFAVIEGNIKHAVK